MDELDLIRSFRANTAPPTALATARAERAWRRPERREPRRPRLGGRVAIAACLAAAATVAALVIPGERESRLGAPEARAAETLRRAAESQKGGLTRPLQPGEFFYTRAMTTWNGRPADRESWVAIDGTRRWLDERQPEADFRVGPREKPFRRRRRGDELRGPARAPARRRGAPRTPAPGRGGLRVRTLRGQRDLRDRRRPACARTRSPPSSRPRCCARRP